MLYRLFPWHPTARSDAPGGPLFDPRAQQGIGRHDNPELYGAIYTSRSPISAVAEWLAAFRGKTLGAVDLVRRDGRRLAIVGLDDSVLARVVDLDDPVVLGSRGLRPSGVATHQRRATQRLAADLFAEGISGFGWWSTLEASWPNVTLFAERGLPALTIGDAPHALTLEDPVTLEAAGAVGVRLVG